MEDKSKQVFDELFTQSENNYCFECGAPSNHWASVNNGIFLCLNCSGLHRGFGVNVSFVRSVTMDSWSDLQLAMMKNGGNAKLRAFFESYNLPKDGPIDFKYKTKAGFYYREMLKAVAEGRDVPQAPSLEEGLELVNTKNTNFTGQTVGFGSTPTESENLGDKVLDSLGKAMNATKEVLVKATDKIKEPGFIKEEVKSLGNKVATGAKTVASKVGQTVTDPNLGNNVKEFGHKVAEGAKTTVTVVGEKTKELWQEREQILNKGADLAKKGFGFFKKLLGKEEENNNDNNTTSEPK